MADKDPFEDALNALDGDDDGDVDPFEAALKSADGDGGAAANNDPFEAALDSAASGAVAPSAKTSPTTEKKEPSINIEFLLDIKLRMTFEVGRTKMIISDLLSLGQGSVIELHRLVGENLDILVNGQLLANGEVVVVNEKFGARISEIISPEERVHRLGQ